MRNKFGIGLLITIILAIVVISSACVILSLFNNDIYAADEYSEDFSFGVIDDKQKQFIGKEEAFVLSNQYTFDMILPKGASYNDVVISEEDSKELLSINGNVVTAVKIGTGGKIKATLNFNGKTYEAITNYEVKDTDFRFPLDNKMQKKYTDKNAFEIGKKTPYEIKMKLPDNVKMSDVTFYERDTELLEIKNQQIIASSEGKGVLIAQITVSGEKREVSTEFEVKNTSKNTDSSGTQSKRNTKSVSTTKVTKKEEVTLKFKNDIKNVASTSSSVINKLTKTGVDDINDLTWTSSDSSIATIENKSGKIKIQGKVGTSTITVTHKNSGVSASYTINSYQKNLDVVNMSNNSKITDGKIAINLGESMDLNVQDVNNSILQEDVKWTSSNEKICTVDENGVITPIKKGKVKIKARLNSNPQSNASLSVTIASSEEEKMFNDTFSFEIDENTNKAMKFTGNNALVVNEEYVFKMLKPSGAENYPVEFSCDKDGLLDISGEYIKALRVGSGNLIATITIGEKKKTTRTKIQVVATQQEKESAVNSSELPYVYVNLDTNKLNVENGKKFTLNSNLETNMHSDEYTIEWESSNDIVKFESNGKKTVRVTPVKTGTTNITVTAKSINGQKQSTISSSTVSIEVKDKVILVKSLKFDTSNIIKSANKCQLAVGDVYFIPVKVFPENATEPGYKLELINDDEENFMIRDDNAIIALVPGKTATLRATALDKSNKSVRVSLESIDSEESVASLQSLSDLSQITVGVGEKQVYRLQNNDDTAIKSNSNIELDEDVDTVTIQGKEEGNSTITLQSGDESIDIPVAVLQSVDDSENVIAPTKLTFAKDPKTGRTKDYVHDYPLKIGWDFDFKLDAEPYNASNEVELFLDNNVDFKVVNNGTQIRPINPKATATLTAVSKYDHSVKATVKIASVATNIKSIEFTEDYTTDEGAFNINKSTSYECYLRIELYNGTIYDPTTTDLTENQDYLDLMDDIEIYTTDKDAIEVISNVVYPINGINAGGTLRARVKADNAINTSTKFKSFGISMSVDILDVKFAKSRYDITTSSSTAMKPIITLTNSKVLDPSKKFNSNIVNTPEYINYLQALELVNMDGNGRDISPTKDIVRINNDKFTITPKANGVCELGIRMQGSKDIIATTILDVNVASNESVSSNKNPNNNSNMNTVPKDNKTTTNDKSLRISKVQFASESYNMRPSSPYIFNPEITLEDGTKLTHESENQEVYSYYCNQLEVFVVGQTPGVVDLAYAHIDNTALPRTIIGQMPGQIMVGIGKKGEVSILDTAIINLAY